MIGRYNSTYGFVETNNLQEEANQLWGKDWEACDDVAQVEELINHLHPNKYLVSFLENVKEDDILVTEFPDMENDHTFIPNGHDDSVFKNFCRIASEFNASDLLHEIITRYCDDQDLKEITKHLEGVFLNR